MKAVIYARVSTNYQDIENSIQAQVKACKDYADKEEYSVEEMYIDKAESGRTSKRPEFLRMISDAKKKQFQVILIHKFDRFSRNREDAVTYKALLKKYKVELISVTEPFTQDLYGKLIEGILEVTNEFYSLNLAQESVKGQKQVLERGFLPSGQVPIGYKGIKILDGNEFHTKIEIDEITAPVIQRVFEMSAQGNFLKEILHYLNQTIPPVRGGVWHMKSLYYILKNNVYIGVYTYNKTTNKKIEKEIYPPIISKELFEKAQRKIKENHGRNKNNKFYLLSGILFCSLCGNKLIGKANGKYRYYICAGNIKRCICPCHYVRADKLEKKIIEKVKKYFKQNIEYIEEKNKPDKKIKQLKIRLNLLQREQNNIINAISQGMSPDLFKAKIEAILDEKKMIETLLEEKKSTPGKKKEIIEMIKFFEYMKNFQMKDFLKLTIKIFHNPKENHGIIKIVDIMPEEKICYKV